MFAKRIFLRSISRNHLLQTILIILVAILLCVIVCLWSARRMADLEPPIYDQDFSHAPSLTN